MILYFGGIYYVVKATKKIQNTKYKTKLIIDVTAKPIRVVLKKNTNIFYNRGWYLIMCQSSKIIIIIPNMHLPCKYDLL